MQSQHRVQPTPNSTPVDSCKNCATAFITAGTDGPSPTAKAPVLKVWPERGKLELLSPDKFNLRVKVLQRAHCE